MLTIKFVGLVAKKMIKAVRADLAKQREGETAGNVEARAIDKAVRKILAANEKDFTSYLHAVDVFNEEAFDPLCQRLGSDLHAMAILLKLSNIAVGRYEYNKRHTQLVARPFGLVVDPANGCPLACPGCLHADNAKRDQIDWQPGNLSLEVFEKIIKTYGPYAITTRFFNWGEPLLNRRTPEYVSMARTYFHRTAISSNLSLHFDVEALVRSGLDYLIMSVDGATQKTYERYRRRGNLALVLDNMRELVAQKQKLQSKTPYLQWQYLLFEHTLPEMDKVMELAEEIGIDEVNFTNPYDVSSNDPTIRLPKEMPLARHILTRPGPAVTQSARNAASGLNEVIREHFLKGWQSRLGEEQAVFLSARTCQWLYKDIVLDANGRVLPCCFLPKKGSTAYFSDVHDKDAFNSDNYIEARSYFSQGRERSHVACHGCKALNSLPNINNQQIPFYFTFIDNKGVFEKEVIKQLADW